MKCRATSAAFQPAARLPPNMRRTWNIPSSTRFGPARIAPMPQLKYFHSDTYTVSKCAEYSAGEMPV
jgi:hypothetical protein